MNNKPHKYTWSIIIFTLNLLLGLIFCFLISPRLMGTGITLLDPDGYGDSGRVLYESGRFDLIEKAPLYPGFVALISLFSGRYNIQAIQVARCMLAALTCVLLYFLFIRTIGETPALAAALICALYPMLIWYTPRLWTDVQLTFLLSVYTLVLVRLLQKPTVVSAIVCGLLVGITALTKGIALVFLVLTSLALLIRFCKESLRLILLFGLAASVLILPWTWRNWQLTGQRVPIHYGGGYNFYLGNCFLRHWSKAPLSYAGLKALTT